MSKFEAYMYNGIGFLKVTGEYCALDVEEIDYLISDLKGLKDKLGVFGTETTPVQGVRSRNNEKSN